MTKTKEELYQEALSKMAVPTTETLIEVLKEMEAASKDTKNDSRPSEVHLDPTPPVSTSDS
jgi:hypothetical protein